MCNIQTPEKGFADINNKLRQRLQAATWSVLREQEGKQAIKYVYTVLP
jgi:hypothetical protein